MNSKYDEEQLLADYKRVCFEEKRVVGLAELVQREDIEATEWVYRRLFGGLDELLKLIGMEKLSSYENRKFCEYCALNPFTCGRDIKECMAEADLYFELADTIV